MPHSYIVCKQTVVWVYVALSTSWTLVSTVSYYSRLNSKSTVCALEAPLVPLSVLGALRVALCPAMLLRCVWQTFNAGTYRWQSDALVTRVYIYEVGVGDSRGATRLWTRVPFPWCHHTTPISGECVSSPGGLNLPVAWPGRVHPLCYLIGIERAIKEGADNMMDTNQPTRSFERSDERMKMSG